ncbi:MAG: monofunctional biosynthetic peptidoglycan transglycosylase [Cytophagales bacterium]
MRRKVAPKKTGRASRSKKTQHSIKGIFKKTLKSLSLVIFGIFLFSLLWVLAYKFLPIPGTPLMLIRKIEFRNDPNFNTRYRWVKFENAGPFTLAVVASEDANFLKHNGFDFKAIQKAIEFNQKNPSKKRGASTISQQVAKNAFLWNGRSWVRKGLEVYFTFLIELMWSKKRILEVYVNIAETGKGLYGIEAASKYYFKKNASKMTRYEATLIASILPNPLKYNASKPSQFLQNRQKWIRRNMDFIGKLEFETKSSKN